MAIIYTYPNEASVQANDTFLITDSADNNTKTVSASAIAAYIDDEVDLQEVLNKGNTATQNINLTGDYNGTGNIGLSGNFSLGGDLTLTKATSQFISKTTGDLLLQTAAGNFDIRATGLAKVLSLRSDLGGLLFQSSSNDLDVNVLNFDVTATGSKIEADTVILGNTNATSLVRITGGNGGSGYYPNVITDEFAFNGHVRFNQVIKDLNGSTGGPGQALLAVAGGKVEWTTINSQTLAQNQILVGNASNVPTASGLITANITTDDITIGVASSKVSVLGSLDIPANGGTKLATSTGNPGEIAWDSNYMYLCIATNTWRRIGLDLIP